MLSDRGIIAAMQRGSLEIDPFDSDCLQPNSVDFHLGNVFKTLRPNHGGMIDPMMPAEYVELTVDGNEARFYLLPGELVLATTVERVRLSPALSATFEGKSSIGRLGLLVHVSAGFFDAGFNGQATLELVNLTQWPIILYPGMKIGQMSFVVLSSPALRPYGHPGLGSKYIDQEGPTGSLMHLNFGNPVVDHERYAQEHD